MRFADMTATEWHEVVGVNLHSTLHLCKAALPHLVAAGNASIIAIGGASQSVLSAPRAHAFASLAGRTVMLQTIAFEPAPQGVRVNFVAPGFIDTVRTHPEWYPGAPPEGIQWAPGMLKQIPLGRPRHDRRTGFGHLVPGLGRGVLHRRCHDPRRRRVGA